MEVALIRIDPDKKDDDGRPKIIASVVVDTSLKKSKQTKPNCDALLALSRAKFRREFAGYSFPRSSYTDDSVLKQWAELIDPDLYTKKVNFSALTHTEREQLKVLVNTIVLSSSADGTKQKQIIATGDYVCVKCNGGRYKLPGPKLILTAANHYILQEFCLMTQTKFKMIYGSSIYIPKTTKDKTLSEIKTAIENDDCPENVDTSLDNEPIIAENIIGSDDGNIMARGKLVPFNTRLPVAVVNILKTVSEKKNKPMSRILIDCILSKYGDQ